MIKRLILIVVLAYILFLLELILGNALGVWGRPELLLLLVVFWGLYSGVRYSLVAAIVAGALKDVFSILPFGTYLFVFVAAAYLTTFVRRTLYQPGSPFSRAVVAFFVLLGSFLIEVCLYLKHYNVYWLELFSNIFLPQLVTTMVVVTFVFHRLRDIAVKFKI
ncbi:MAG: rod shape-determining protein MreD [Candidatus Omnitrophota bacterium]